MKLRVLKACCLSALLLVRPPQVHADEVQPKVVRVFRFVQQGGKTAVADHVAALINMDGIEDRPGDNCEQMLGPVKVEGVQFSQSGATLESFRFTATNGAQWSVPTNIDKLSNVERGWANSFIRVGKTYFAHIQVCGSGGFASLISLYNISEHIGP